MHVYVHSDCILCLTSFRCIVKKEDRGGPEGGRPSLSHETQYPVPYTHYIGHEHCCPCDNIPEVLSIHAVNFDPQSAYGTSGFVCRSLSELQNQLRIEIQNPFGIAGFQSLRMMLNCSDFFLPLFVRDLNVEILKQEFESGDSVVLLCHIFSFHMTQ